jgi:hypothetical protein
LAFRKIYNAHCKAFGSNIVTPKIVIGTVTRAAN